MKGIQSTLLKGLGWFFALLGLGLGIYSCFQYFTSAASGATGAGSGYGFAFSVTFVTLTFTFILLSIELPPMKKFNFAKIKLGIYALFAAIDVLLLVFAYDGMFTFYAVVMFAGMVLAALVFKLEFDAIEKRKKLLGLVFLAVVVVLAAVVVLLDPANPGSWLFYLFLAYGIVGMVGWDTLQSIFWNQKLRSIICLGIAIALGWIFAVVMLLANLSWVNLLGPVFLTAGLALVLGIEAKLRKKKLLIYIK